MRWRHKSRDKSSDLARDRPREIGFVWEKWKTEKEELQQQTNLSFLVHVGILANEVEEFIFMKEQEHITAVQRGHPAFYKGTLDLAQGIC